MLPEGWKEIFLGNILDFKNGLNADKAAYGHGCKFVNVMDVINNTIIKHENIIGKVNTTAKNIDLFKLKYGDILFNRTSETKEEIALSSVYMDYSLAVYGGFVIRGRPKNSNINTDFSLYFFQSPSFRNQAIKSAQGVVRANIGQDSLSRILLPLPPLPEQKKIAAILSTWDRAIEGTEKLLANSQQQKKALMQQLLTGKKRLPGFTGEWKTKTFLDIFNLKIGGTPSRSNPAYWDTDKITENRWVAISDLRTAKIRKTAEHISDLGAKKSNCSLIPKGTIILSFKLTIGKKAILLEDCYTNEAICALIIKDKNEINSSYVYQALDNVNYEEEIDQAVKGKTLNKEKLARLRILAPPLPEQKAIAAVLSTADEEITALESDLSRLRQEKKALMQQLLTGKIRVAV